MWAFISDKRKYECAACQHLFRHKESVCEDWRDPAKSFLCPKCSAYLEVPEERKADRIMKYGFPILIIAGGLSLYYSERWVFTMTLLVVFVAIAFVQAAPNENIQTKMVGSENAQ
jgi:hypothetical protein